jgi:NitT/TauT family transport system permease protein
MAIKLHIWRGKPINLWQINRWDLLALAMVFAIFALLASNATQMTAPYQLGKTIPISLSIVHLPFYAIRTVIRLLIALIFSLLFSFVVGYLAAKNKHAERFIIPAIDILQSVPILGFLSITIAMFIALFPHRLLGPELAAIFAIFTGQAWNMTLGFYQSLKTVPVHLKEASNIFQLSAWQRFWRLEVPFAMPSLIWNAMMSMSASWFFITLAEAITVNNQTIMLPGVGSYIAMAITHRDKAAVIYAIITMIVVIFLYDQLIFRPLIVWSKKFNLESSEEEEEKKELTAPLLTLFRRTQFLQKLGKFIDKLSDKIINFRLPQPIRTLKVPPIKQIGHFSSFVLIYVWYSTLIIVGFAITFALVRYLAQTVSIEEVARTIVLGVYTSIRIFILLILCSLVWVPIGVWVGLRPRITQIVQPIAQLLAAFPANLVFPVIFMLIVRYKLNVEIWTTPLMILGTQWYILFNVIAGASAIPKNLRQAIQNFGVKRWLRWKRLILPCIFPYFLTGVITAAGGAWNASIVAEIVHWGNTSLKATGLGAYIFDVTLQGDFPRIALGISVMCIYVLFFNRLIWQPLYRLAERRFQLD